MTTITPVCLGVICEVHSDCLRYHAVDFADPRSLRIGTCGHARSLFVPLYIHPVSNHPVDRRHEPAGG